jgi:hypothetical protein
MPMCQGVPPSRGEWRGNATARDGCHAVTEDIPQLLVSLPTAGRNMVVDLDSKLLMEGAETGGEGLALPPPVFCLLPLLDWVGCCWQPLAANQHHVRTAATVGWSSSSEGVDDMTSTEPRCWWL